MLLEICKYLPTHKQDKTDTKQYVHFLCYDTSDIYFESVHLPLDGVAVQRCRTFTYTDGKQDNLISKNRCKTDEKQDIMQVLSTRITETGFRNWFQVSASKTGF